MANLLRADTEGEREHSSTQSRSLSRDEPNPLDPVRGPHSPQVPGLPPPLPTSVLSSDLSAQDDDLSVSPKESHMGTEWRLEGRQR